MSHTTQIDEFYIIHNGDFSGDVQITRREGIKAEPPQYTHVATLPYWLIERIVATRIRNERIAALEQASPAELLGVHRSGPTYD